MRWKTEQDESNNENMHREDWADPVLLGRCASSPYAGRWPELHISILRPSPCLRGPLSHEELLSLLHEIASDLNTTFRSLRVRSVSLMLRFGPCVCGPQKKHYISMLPNARITGKRGFGTCWVQKNVVRPIAHGCYPYDNISVLACAAHNLFEDVGLEEHLCEKK